MYDQESYRLIMNSAAVWELLYYKGQCKGKVNCGSPSPFSLAAGNQHGCWCSCATLEKKPDKCTARPMVKSKAKQRNKITKKDLFDTGHAALVLRGCTHGSLRKPTADPAGCQLKLHCSLGCKAADSCSCHDMADLRLWATASLWLWH